MSILSSILENKIVAILRGANPADSMEIARAMLEGGVKVLEITLNSPEAETTIKSLAKALGNKMVIGAGTVLNGKAAVRAMESGATFIISPHTDPDTISVTKKKGAVSIPGAFTPGEIVAAHQAGGDIIKVFPAVLGPGYIRDILAPLPHILLMPTGGIGANNIRQFRDAGAVAFGIGNALFNAREKITSDYLSGITEKSRQLVSALA
jgi:2-dehydro-3-deoxyphosphogluconate aldolase/(4S)-4-hydroxy-2-oxoglutarate aldolase